MTLSFLKICCAMIIYIYYLVKYDSFTIGKHGVQKYATHASCSTLNTQLYWIEPLPSNTHHYDFSEVRLSNMILY